MCSSPETGNNAGGKLVFVDYVLRVVIIPVGVSVWDSFGTDGMRGGSKVYVICMCFGLFPDSSALLWEEGTGQDYMEVMEGEIVGLRHWNSFIYAEGLEV